MEFTIKVSGMSCEHCVARVKKAILEINGVSSCEVDLKTGTVKVEASAEGLEEKVKEAVREAGYSIT
ncbi:hypothetical protein DBT_2041 [Dissulfuribacter thermophilus]|uniref:HMA domain-containing protein n=1 Tax=Dissulfuribacter thermophilus TaxID=1156395 RepID=A0A1B9F3K5_9BACT|nr:copper ion binding protein [Dissulfuribacter thermophilus]OCC14500.1 hypothetical protein DBT_2041 [Dissulfuribacter thermophilus]